ncbi:MAG: hypothetical protein LBG59_03685 [Candidatus Peribacteria bacterium]|jgi:hypothetical protein|nr:hypothetical protein [Candidatus Peribacteria bacterium]
MTNSQLLADAEQAIQGIQEYFEEEKTKVMVEAELATKEAENVETENPISSSEGT